MACGTALKDVVGCVGAERQEVFELPPVQLVVTEQRIVLKTCPGCGQETAGADPAGLLSGASSGAGVKRLLTALNQAHLVPSERSCQIVADLCGQPVSEGTLQAALAGWAAALLETATHSKQGLSQADVAHCDETGMYVAAKRGWRHSASPPQLTPDAYHAKRGSQATRALGVLPSLQRRAIHDGFSAYWQ